MERAKKVWFCGACLEEIPFGDPVYREEDEVMCDACYQDNQIKNE